MPRTRRFEFAGEIHPVLARGLEGRNIFADNEDWVKFLALLEKNPRRYSVGCLAFSPISNHYYLVLRPHEESLGICLRALKGAYAQYFNRCQTIRGYLFLDRYETVQC